VLTASIITVISGILMVEAVNASEMLIYVYKITRCNISEAFLDFVQL